MRRGWARCAMAEPWLGCEGCCRRIQLWDGSRGAVGGGVAVVVRSPGVGGLRDVASRGGGAAMVCRRILDVECQWCREMDVCGVVKYTWSQNPLFQQFTMVIRSRMNIAL